MRRLIVNADDFGLTAGVNRGILAAHHAGLLTSTTLMANSRAFADAVRLAQAEPRLDVGCHLVLLGGAPLLPPEQVVTLVGSGGQFRGSLLDFARAAMAGRLSADEITSECVAQIRKIQQAGIAVTHVDTHKHVHMFPRVLEPVLRAARACGVAAVRNPYTFARPLELAALARRPRLWKRYAQVWMLRRFGREFRQRVAAAGMITPDGTFGIVGTGALDLKLFRAVVAVIPEGIWEFVCHPGYDDADLAAAGTRLRRSRARELEVLTSAEARVFLAECDIQLISYQELISEHSNSYLRHGDAEAQAFK